MGILHRNPNWNLLKGAGTRFFGGQDYCPPPTRKGMMKEMKRILVRMSKALLPGSLVIPSYPRKAVLRRVPPPVFLWELCPVPALAQARQGEHSTPGRG